MFLASVMLRYVNIFTDRHGTVRAYYRRSGRSVALKGTPGSPAFMAAYAVELSRDDSEPKKAAARPHSIDELARIYYASPDFKRLQPLTQKTYRSSIDQFCAAYGSRSVSGLQFEHVSAIIGAMSDRPAAANKLLKRLRTLFKLAIRLRWIRENPGEGVPYFKTGEYHTWTAEEHAQFVKHWPEGTKPRLAYLLHFHTGQRRSDVIGMTRPKSADDVIRVTQQKTGAKLVLPVPEPLWAEIERHEAAHMVLLSTEYGKPYTVAGFGNWFRDRCRDAGLPDRCRSHGLRKAAATELADAGCSAKEIQAITGHRSLVEVERYTRAADQERLAKSANAKRSANTMLQTQGPDFTNPKNSA
jgi:integrase